jgi:hypothetical protein
MSNLPPAYLAVITPLIDKARGFLEQGDQLYPVAFVGNFTTQAIYPVLMNTDDPLGKESTSRAIRGLADQCEADFVLVISESWTLRQDKMPKMKQIIAEYGSIGASPYRIDSVSITLETLHGLWVSSLPIKPRGVSKKKRTFGSPDFQLFTEVEGLFAHLLPKRDAEEIPGSLH